MSPTHPLKEPDPARDDAERQDILENFPDATVCYYGTDHDAVYRIVGGSSAWSANPRYMRWNFYSSHRHVLDEVTGHGGSAAHTPRISRAEALRRLSTLGIAPDELDELPEEPPSS
jgi:hypothetical protein